MPYFAPPAAFLSAGLALQATLLLVTVLIVLLVASLLHRPGPDEPNSLPGYSLLHIVPFFRKRYDFLSWGFHAAAANVFQFNLLRVGPFILSLCHAVTSIQNQVVVVSGEDARQTFFTAKNLDLTEGFKILSGAVSFTALCNFFRASDLLRQDPNGSRSNLRSPDEAHRSHTQTARERPTQRVVI